MVYGSSHAWQKLLAKYGLLIFLVVITVGFSIFLPSTFSTVLTWKDMLQANYLIVILAIAETICIACGEFDLSIANNVILLHILCLGLIERQHVAWYLACLVVLVIAAGIGAINGMLVYFWRISSFVVTLGVGTIVLGFALLYTGPLQIMGPLPQAFVNLENSAPLGVPDAAIAVLVIVIVMTIVMELTVSGRYFYALGANRKAAVLAGIRPGKYIIGVFVASGILTGIGAIMYASQFGVSDEQSAQGFFLPLFTAAILGSSVMRPGRPNIVGTLIAVAVLGVGFTGLLQLGSGVPSQDVFNGLALIFGVGLAGTVARRANSVRKESQTLSLPSLPEDVSDIVPQEILNTEADHPSS